jgi:hypothetical protein
VSRSRGEVLWSVVVEASDLDHAGDDLCYIEPFSMDGPFDAKSERWVHPYGGYKETLDMRTRGFGPHEHLVSTIRES